MLWMTSEDEGMRLVPAGIKAISSKDMVDHVIWTYDKLRTSPHGWCDDTMILMLNDQRTITQHLLLAVQGEGPTAVVYGFLSMGRNEERGEAKTESTIHAVCAAAPAILAELVKTLVEGGRLASFGIQTVRADIFTPNVALFSHYDFRVESSDAHNATVVYTVPKGGRRRKSKSVRTKRKRMTRRNRLKQ